MTALLSDPRVSYVLANAVLVLHAAVVAFVVGGLALVPLGHLRNWHGVDTLWFRLAHLAAIGVIVAESWAGVACPLTTLETWLRSRAGVQTYTGGFVEHWLQHLLFYSAPPWVFMLAYSVFGLAVLATWWYFPPGKSAMRRRRSTAGR